MFPVQETWVWYLLSKLDPTCSSKSSHAATETWCSQINKYLKIFKMIVPSDGKEAEHLEISYIAGGNAK